MVVSVPYSGGNGGYYDELVMTGTEVNGLIATLPEGRLSNGSGTLDLILSGIPTSAGAANFELSVAGKTCTVPVPVYPADGILDTCGAYVATGVWKNFMCYNLGAANTEADPMTPSWEINGGYWVWGRKGPEPHEWQTTNTAHFKHGPTGPQFEQSNYNTNASSGLSEDGDWPATADPCPEGYRIPTSSEWSGVKNRNSVQTLGSWVSTYTNYSSGRFFGPSLFLPAAGFYNGGLNDRGLAGSYWSRTHHGVRNSNTNWNWVHFGIDFHFSNSSIQNRQYRDKSLALSIRCIAE